MSDLLQVTCPQCQTRLQVKRPAAATARTRCSCGHTFTFKVPAAAAVASSDASNDDLFASLPDPGPSLGGSPVDLSGTPPRPSRRRSTGGFFNGAKRKRSPNQAATVRWQTGTPAKTATKKNPTWLPIVVVASLLVVVGATGIGVWKFLGGRSLLPSPLAAFFESPEAIFADANANDLAVKRFVERYLEDPQILETNNLLLPRLHHESKMLAVRVATLPPLSESEATELDIKFGSEGVSGPIDSEQRRSLLEELFEARDAKPKLAASAVATVFAQNDFARELLRHGHLEYGDSDVPVENVLIEQIGLLREFNRLVGEITLAELGEFPDEGDDDSVEVKPKSKEEAKAYFDAIYQPVFDDIDRITKRLRQLAVKRYELGRRPKGDTRQFREVLYYVEQTQAQVLPHRIILRQSGTELVDYLVDFRKAWKEVDLVAAGVKPSLIAEADKKEAEANQERKRREAEREARIAAAEKARETPPDTPAVEETTQTASKQDDTKGNDDLPRPEQMAERPESDSQPSLGPDRGFGRPQGIRPRFGDARTVGPDPGRFMRKPRRQGRTESPQLTESEMVVIKMSSAGGISPKEQVPKFSRALNCSVHWQTDGGRLTITLGYGGSLENVVKLIDFGKVKSLDHEARLITLER